ncbi:MAG: hypothetical protein HKN42_15790, partial [Granulosicoccus sp.]|nr:hypothetical protein [Granulosicoccus sp.]
MDDSISRAEAYWRNQDASDTDISSTDANDRVDRDTVNRDTVKRGTVTDTGKPERIPLGMDSFDAEAHHRFGQSIRLAMACMDGSGSPPPSDHPGNAL